mgnify:CR=1 FL=1
MKILIDEQKAAQGIEVTIVCAGPQALSASTLIRIPSLSGPSLR